MITINHLRDYLIDNDHDWLVRQYGGWLRRHLYMEASDALEVACCQGLYDLCEAIGAPMDWSDNLVLSGDPLSDDQKALLVIPGIMEILNEYYRRSQTVVERKPRTVT